MPTFSYTVHDLKGKITSGQVEGTSREDVARAFLDQGLTPVVLSQSSGARLNSLINNIGWVSSADKVLFAEELSTLINAGVPIDQSLDILTKQASNKKLKNTVAMLSRDVQGGLSLSSALAKYPQVFSSVFVNMVKAGEIGGTLDEALNRLAEQLAKDHELVAKIKGALTYPIVIMVAMVGAMIYMMVSIVPNLAKMFEEMGGELPATTKTLIFISDAFSSYIFITIPILIGLVVAYRLALKKISKFRFAIHTLLLKVPVFSRLIKKTNVARFTRTLSSLLKSGVGVPEALDIVAQSTHNMIYRQAIEKTVERVRNGTTIAENLKQFKVFPPIVPQMIAVGEETGSLDVILGKVANFYDREVDNMTKNLSTMLEPLIMVILGIMVGFLIVSIITPIYQMTDLV